MSTTHPDRLDPDPFVDAKLGPVDPTIKQLALAHPLVFRGRPPEIWSDLPAGWSDVVDQFFTRVESTLTPTQLARLKVAQVKEKFGGLRIYLDYRGARSAPAWTQVVEWLREAQQQSAQTCQVCGRPGALTTIRMTSATLCPEHLSERQNRPA